MLTVQNANKHDKDPKILFRFLCIDPVYFRFLTYFVQKMIIVSDASFSSLNLITSKISDWTRISFNDYRNFCDYFPNTWKTICGDQ